MEQDKNRRHSSGFLGLQLNWIELLHTIATKTLHQIMVISNTKFISTLKHTSFNSRRLLLLSGALLLLMFCTGCSVASDWFQAQFSPSNIELAILQVEPATRPGIYTVSGNTTLPEQTQVTVAAVRLLGDFQSTSNENAEPAYEILDRQFAMVEQGNWQANLNLWRVDSDGNFREAWQITQQHLETQFEPSSEVTFTATFDPAQQPPNFQQQIEEESNLARANLAQYNSDGELYLQTSRTLTIALPIGNTAPPEASSTLVKVIGRQAESQVADTALPSSASDSATAQSRSDAPLSPGEFLR